MIAFNNLSEDVKRIQVWSPDINMWSFCYIPNFGHFKNMHFCTILLNLLKTKYCCVINEVQPFKMVLSFKNVYLKMTYTRHYFKMRKLLTGAKLLFYKYKYSKLRCTIVRRYYIANAYSVLGLCYVYTGPRSHQKY